MMKLNLKILPRQMGCLRDMKTIFLIDNPVRDIAPLGGITGLENLGLTAAEVDNIAPLSTLNNLKFLGFSRTAVENLLPLKDLKALKELTLTGTSAVLPKNLQATLALFKSDVGIEIALNQSVRGTRL